MKIDWAAYVMYVNRPDLLKRALDVFPDLWDNLTVVDNSPTGIGCELPKSCELFMPPVPLTYSQSMNWMLADAECKRVDFILHFHSDATCSNVNAVAQLLEYARVVKAADRKWGCLWTFYDTLWALNPVACRDVGGWNTAFPSYFVDQDMKQRWRMGGWETIDTHIEGVTHEGSATIRSDPKLGFLNGATFPLYEELYRKTWGGKPEFETYSCPFNRPDLFGRE